MESAMAAEEEKINALMRAFDQVALSRYKPEVAICCVCGAIASVKNPVDVTDCPPECPFKPS